MRERACPSPDCRANDDGRCEVHGEIPEALPAFPGPWYVAGYPCEGRTVWEVRAHNHAVVLNDCGSVVARRVVVARNDSGEVAEAVASVQARWQAALDAAHKETREGQGTLPERKRSAANQETGMEQYATGALEGLRVSSWLGTDAIEGFSIPKSGPVRKRNPVRAAKRREECYGKHAAWVAGHCCFVCEKMGKVQAWPTVAAHAGKTRGAGGKARDIVDLCGGHERLWHYHGCETFDRIFAVNCKARAAYLWSVSPHNPENREADKDG